MTVNQLKNLVKDSGQMVHLAGSNSTGPGRAILKAAEVLRNDLRKHVETQGRITEAISTDIRYQLGAINALNTILELPGMAEEFIKTQNGEEL